MIRKPKISKNCFAILFAVITTMLLLSLFSTIYGSTQPAFTDDNGQSKTPLAVDSNTPAMKSAVPETQFQVEIAYAYVGPLPPEKASYYSQSFNQTMVATSKLPSSVLLNFIRVPSIQISSCDAVIQVYGIKIAADTGPTEYHAWSAGMNYTALTHEDISTLLRNSDNLIDRNLYRSIGGTFHNMWAADQSVLSQKIGSVGEYTGNRTHSQQNVFDLSSVGTPNKISVEVRRIGYVTVTNGSVKIYKDAITVNEPVAYAQLSKYEDGFIYNNLVPAEKLSQIDLFHPPS